MRLHHLQIEAFGPFATSAEVDFDTLSAAGLFLLSGPTGAGKTSVLDAVCFALYGDVPGDRASAKRLRCDQAAPQAVPRVTLETTLSGRRFRIVRSPAWARPKRRGTGTTLQQSSVTISELVGGEWQPLSSRIDETGDLVTRLVGMNLPQFTQVVMLPQGRFQQFLRARSDDRHRLLQQLFRTGRFEDVERWLRDRRLELSRQCGEQHDRVAALVSRLSEAAGTALPPDWDLHALAGHADDLAPWATTLAADTGAAADAARGPVTALAEAEVRARRALEQGRADAERRARYAAAAAELAGLEETAGAHADDERRLAAARRAAAVVPLHGVAVTTASGAARAQEQALAACDTLAHRTGLALDPADTALLERLARATADRAAEVRAALPRAEALRTVQREADAVAAEIDRVRERLAVLEVQRARLPETLEVLREQCATAREAAVRTEALERETADLRERLTALEEAERLRVQVDSARAGWLDARQATLELRDTLLELQTVRIEGMAAELAGALAVGACCPVCGSCEHPSKAHPAPGAPDAAAERRARSAVDDAAAAEHAHHQKLRDLEQALAVAEGRAGTDAADGEPAEATERAARLGAALDERRDLLGATRAEAGRLDGLTQQLRDAEARLAELERAASAAEAEAARHHAREAALREQATALHGEVDALLDGTASTSLPDLSAHLDATEQGCQAALRLAREAAVAREAAEQARAALVHAAREAGGEEPHEAVAAALDRDAEAELAARLDHHRRRTHAVREVLAEPGAAAVLDAEPPDVEALAAAHEGALDQLSVAQTELRVATTRAERVTGLAAELAHELAAWAPVRAALDTATTLCSFVEGKSADNRLRMRLSAYVLAYRLSQVVEAANERLVRMGEGRYALEHTGQRGAGETRGGLSLLVRDDWSGETRDPATLSGGETFVVSLALALGLADVITQETGGAALDTLFVDEGFGSLDADTLDGVMDVLDSLRDGGRVVGVVSHVAEMRDRIPTQLVVGKARDGSTLGLRR